MLTRKRGTGDAGSTQPLLRRRTPTLLLFTLAAAAALLAVMLWANLGLLRLSFVTLTSLKPVASRVLPDRDESLLPLIGGGISDTNCVSARSLLAGRFAGQLTTPNAQRLSRFLSVICESGAEAARRFLRERAAEGTPTSFEALNLSAIMDSLGQLDSALELRKAEPLSSLWYVHRGRLAIERDHNETLAFDYFRLAQAITPEYAQLKISMYLYLCLASVRDNEIYVLPTACQDFDRADSSASSALLLGRFYLNAAQYAQAQASLSRAVILAPHSGESYYWLGLAHKGAGSSEVAAQVFGTGIQFAPTYPWNYLELARLEIGAGCLTAARAHLTSMLTLDGARDTAATALEQIADGQDDCRLPLAIENSAVSGQ